MKRLIITLLTVTALLTLGFVFTRPASPQQVRARVTTADAMRGDDSAGFARALEPRPFLFPADHGPHPEFQTEWWYFTGNLQTADGRPFGFQLTFFRRALTANQIQRTSAWAANDLYLAHFAISDIDGEQFYAFERFSRGAAGLAGAKAPFRVWVDDWFAEGSEPQAMQMQLRARQGDLALDLALDGSARPPVLQGDRGLSQKSAEPGNASFYYSLTRMPARGTITIANQPFSVEGLAWMDREWSTSALAPDQVGWDWFALQLDDGRDLMYYQIRRNDGSPDPFSKGVLVATDGSAELVRSGDVQLVPIGQWRSPRSGAIYPAGWNLRIPAHNIDLTVRPRLADQELPTSVIYWEGSVAISGTAGAKPIAGTGYLEMTGYSD